MTFEKLLDFEATEWFKSTKADMTPGMALRAYRTRENLTKEELGPRIGGVPRQHISGMEMGTRPIGREMAKRLAEALRFDYRKIL
jgi:plasmid maintenance system antidote protein VapI